MKVNVIGMGKLGLPLALLLGEHNEVLGIDLNEKTIEKLNNGVMPFEEDQLRERFNATSDVSFTSSFDDSWEAEATFIVVPTPSKDDATFSNDYLVDAVTRLGSALEYRVRSHLVVIVSTVMPGATETIIQTALETASGRSVGTSLMLAYSPEFIALGEVFKGMEAPDMVLIGTQDQHAASIVQTLLKSFIKNKPAFHVMSITEAELTKIAINTYITTKISYANYLGELCSKIGADVKKVTAAVGADSRIGTKYFNAGTPFGGPCFPRDARALAAFSESVEVSPDMPLATATVNERQVDRIVDLVEKVLPPDGRVAILGLSYKPGTWVTEESAGRKLAERLVAQGLTVVAFDPMATVEGVDSATSLQAAMHEADVVVIATAWKEFAYVSTMLHPDAYLVRWA